MARRTQDADARERLRNMMERNAQGAERTHWLVTWDVEKIVLPLAHVRALVVDAGLSDIPVPDIRVSSAVYRAIKEMAEDRIVREVWSDAEETAWALIYVGRADKETKTAELRQEHTVVYHKSPRVGAPQVEYSSEEARRSIEPHVHRYLSAYTSRDISSRILHYAVRIAGASPLRDRGGVYLVPYTGERIVSALRAFGERVEATATDEVTCRVTAFPIPDTPQTRADMRFHGHRALLSELQSARRSLKDMLRDDRAGKVGADTIANYLAQVDEIGARAALFRDVMQLRLDEMNQAMDALRAGFLAVRTGVAPDHFGATLAGVDNALDAARVAGAQEDPFQLPELPFGEADQLRAGASSTLVDDPFATV